MFVIYVIQILTYVEYVFLYWKVCWHSVSFIAVDGLWHMKNKLEQFTKCFSIKSLLPYL